MPSRPHDQHRPFPDQPVVSPGLAILLPPWAVWSGLDMFCAGLAIGLADHGLVWEWSVFMGSIGHGRLIYNRFHAQPSPWHG